jgi:hypothetical protein
MGFLGATGSVTATTLVCSLPCGTTSRAPTGLGHQIAERRENVESGLLGI